MNVERIRDHCLGKRGATEGFPFGDTTLVFKVMGKMFALMDLAAIPTWINLKCDPERALELRERYGAVTPGYHMNKKHWNTVRCDGSLPDAEIYDMIDHSYERVVQNLKRADREALARFPA